MIEALKDLITGIFDGPGFDVAVYIALGAVALSFVIPLVIALLTGEFNAFKKAANKVLNDPSAKNLNAGMLMMPVKVKKLYKRSRHSEGKPSDIINVDACVNVPYSASLFGKIGPVVGAVTIISAVAAAFAGFAVMGEKAAALTFSGAAEILAGVTAVVFTGALFRLAAGIVSAVVYSGAIKKYNALMDVIDKAVKGGEPADVSEPAEEAPDTEEENIPFVENVDSEDIPFEHSDAAGFEQQPVSNIHADFDGPSRITVELDGEEEPFNVAPVQVEEEPEPAPVIMTEPVEDEAAIRARAREEAIARARAAQAEAQAQAQADREARERAARAQAQAARAAQAAAHTAPAENREAESKASSASTEDVIARIEKINQEGAPLATMKEVALLLQQERAKPENKTPEQQRKLNEALSKLLKAMSGANRK